MYVTSNVENVSITLQDRHVKSLKECVITPIVMEISDSSNGAVIELEQTINGGTRNWSISAQAIIDFIKSNGI